MTLTLNDLEALEPADLVFTDKLEGDTWSDYVDPRCKTWTWECEFTDLFGGQANYSWLRRAEIQVPAGASQRVVVAAGKAALGLTGVRCETIDCGDWYQLRPVGSQTVAFIRAC